MLFRSRKLPNLDYVFREGVDRAVQVVESDVFDFDFEVQAVVHALKARVVLESLQEVQHELDLRTLAEMKARVRLSGGPASDHPTIRQILNIQTFGW